jgi:hypothetical protein
MEVKVTFYKWALRIFMCSSFRDLKEEHNALQQEHLSELYIQQSIQFQMIDLCRGVSEEASFDRQTTNICLTEPLQ